MTGNGLRSAEFPVMVKRAHDISNELYNTNLLRLPYFEIGDPKVHLPSLKSGYIIESGRHVRGPASNLTKFSPVEGFGPKPSTGPLRLSYGARSLPKMAF